MPRPWTISVAAWSRLVEGRPYDVRVIDVKKSTAPDGMLVTLEHLQEQCGRRHVVLLCLPCRSAGLTAEFFRACGQEVKANARLRPTDCVDRVVAASFRAKSDNECEPTGFEAANMESSDGR